MTKGRATVFSVALGVLLIIAGTLLYVQRAMPEEVAVHSQDPLYNVVNEHVAKVESTEMGMSDVQELRTRDGLTYMEIQERFSIIEAKYATDTTAKNEIANLYVTDLQSLSSSINKEAEEEVKDCCKAIPLYRLNTQTQKYDVAVPDIRALPGYKENVDEFTYKNFQYIFSWSEDGRYVFFAHGGYESSQSGGGMFLDMQNLDKGFDELPQYFRKWLVSPDKTKAIAIEFTSDPTHTAVDTYFVVDFNTLKITPIFVDRLDGSRIFSYATMGMGPEIWPYIQWLNDSTVEFYTMSSDAVVAADQCTDVEVDMATCIDDIIKKNFSTLKRHEMSVN